jgi:hypothetical protein
MSAAVLEDRVFQALADPSRRAIFESLTRGEVAVKDLYQVRASGMKPLLDWIAHYRAFWTEHVERLENLLEKMDE